MKGKIFKRGLSLALTMMLLLSCVVFVAADSQVTAVANGTALASGGSIPAISTVTFTLPNSITEEQLKTAVTFEEFVKATSTWSTRLYKGVVSGNKLTATFAAGDLAMNSQYRFTFKSPAVTGEDQIFTFNTTKVGSYYAIENFSRFPETAPVSANGGLEIAAPWYNTRNRYSSVSMSMVKNSVGRTVLRLNCAKPYSATPDVYGTVGFDNAYAPAFAGGTSHVSVSETEFTVQGNPSSIFEIAGIIMMTDKTTKKTGLYVRTSEVIQGTQSNTASKCTSLNYEVASPTDTPTKHTLKYIVGIPGFTYTQTRTFYKIWFDGKEVPMPAGGITATFHSLSAEDTVNLVGATGHSYLFCATNNYTLGESDTGISQNTVMDVYSYQYATLQGVSEIVAENDPLFNVNDSIEVQFGATPTDTDEDALAQKIALKDSLGNSVAWVYGADSYNATTNSMTVQPKDPLAHNKTYTVSVDAMPYQLIGNGAAFSKSFTTGWEKLTASTDTIRATAENFAPTVSVENITSSSVTYTTKLALYKEENGIVQQVATVDTTQAALAVGNSETISVGSVSDPNPSRTANYFAKIFFIEGADTIAKNLVIGTDYAKGTGLSTGNVSTISFTPEPNPNVGRIDVQGRYVGGLAAKDRGLFVTVTNPSGTVLYNDQFASGIDGSFGFGFNLIQGSIANGNYTVTVKPSDGAAFTGAVAMSFDSVQPSITKLEILGDAVYGETLEADYKIYDFVERNDASLVTWQIADTEDGNYVDVATGKGYTIPETAAGKYLKCQVTPKVYLSGNTGSTSDGVPYSTDDAEIDPIYLASKPIATGVVIRQAEGSNQVTLNYAVSDPLKHGIGVRRLTWKLKNLDGSIVKTIENSDSDIYAVSASDSGKILVAEVTPCIKPCDAEDCMDQLSGVATLSNELTLKYTETQADTTTDDDDDRGGGGRGGFGGVVSGAGKPKEKESAPVYQGPESTIIEAGAKDLSDARNHWAAEEIFELYDKGIIKGRTENEFDPNGQITRAEFVAILVRAMGVESVAYKGSFGDVSSGQWYADVLETAKANGLFDGSEGQAYPDRAISREEMVQIIVRAYEKVCGEISVGGGFLEYGDAAGISTWARNAVIKATEVSLVQGTEDGSFAPKSNTTRAESAVIISRLMKHLEKAIAAQSEAA